MEWMEVVPAYGQDYKTQAEVKRAWAEGKDFKIPYSGTYCSKAEADRLGWHVNVRYANMRKVVTVQ